MVEFKKKKEMNNDIVDQQIRQSLQNIKNNRAIEESKPDPNLAPVPSANQNLDVNSDLNTFTDLNTNTDPNMVPNATTNPYSNGTGSARPVFGEPTQDALGQVKQGVSMKKVLFKK